MKSYTLLSSLILIFCYSSALAQLKGASSLDSKSMFQQTIEQSSAIDKISKTENTPVASIVNDNYYYVGPGDVLSLQIIPSYTLEQMLVVSPENTIIVNRNWEMNLKGKTLAEVKKMISDTISSNISNAKSIVGLKQSRSVLVNIDGNVFFPGSYIVPASYCVSTLLKIANQPKTGVESNQALSAQIARNQEMKDEKFKFLTESGFENLLNYSRRNIFIRHLDKTGAVADIDKYYSLSDNESNPYLREGDEIFVPFDKNQYPTVSISGAVRRSCISAFKAGDKASFMLGLCAGLSEDADLENIYLVSPGTNERKKLSVDKSGILAEDYDLQPGSLISVGQKVKSKTSSNGVISVVGCVANPGAYISENNNLHLKDLIGLAGGFTDDAYLPLAYILRKDVNEKKNEYYERLKSFQYSDLLLEDTMRYDIHINLRKPYLACDFVAAFNKNSSNDNVKLEDGDFIVIPANPKKVFVFGQVNNPGYVEFVEGKTLSYYIDRAGGYGPGAEKERSRIIRGKTKAWIESKENIYVYAGDEIYVPTTPDVPETTKQQARASYVNYITAGVSVLATLSYLIISIWGKK
ncbi:MAG: SLBB domain-containing protein [Candidatus Kapabacteria bacterium]|nr:SLBB domain-containing protein [Candidatus Kapabacteria bacterium]